MKILLTNDDSLDSPLFHFAIDYLKSLGEVAAVVPTEEQSWKGKAMTRFDPLHLEPLDNFDCEAYSFSGTPADCANFGIYHLFEDRPDLVISGINMGSNVGLGFAISSGTIGAGLEANIAGVPAVALSQVLPSGSFQYWVTNRKLPPDVQEVLFTRIHAMLDQVFDLLQSRSDFLSTPVTWNVNMPAEPAEDWKVCETFLGQTIYTSCFRKNGDVFQHDIERPEVDRREGSDGITVRSGHVSMTRIDIRVLGQT